MPESASVSSTQTPPRSEHTATSDAYDPLEDFDDEIDEMMREMMRQAAAFGDWREVHNSEVLGLRTAIHALWETIRDMKRENKRVSDRVKELSAAASGDAEAAQRLRRRAELEKSRDTLVKVLTGKPTWTWDTYINSMPEGSCPLAAGEVLYQATQDAIPIYEAKARMPERANPESIWLTIIKGKAREDRAERVAMEAEYEKRVQEAQEAQHVLALLKDEEVLKLFF